MVQSQVFWKDPDKFCLLSLYEQRIHRNFHRNFKLYRELKKERESSVKTNPPAEAEQPRAMTAGATASAPNDAGGRQTEISKRKALRRNFGTRPRKPIQY